MRRRLAREHTPCRPSWRCATCGAAWPCSPAKLGLLGRFRGDRVGLLVLLGELLVDAAGELPADVDLCARFITWARRQAETEPRRP
ncbi:flavin reductase [Micromonospora sp. WMMD882]|uniref:flavin reductase n=1 Tax=Micromonospora sp. WMMD882 TaxID=3015151 RepID=UPI00248D2C6C|nr:flavin reductase [Micromonospora sp. WMMD882]WBB81551.1 flavin reductase [Micromonospora sp. WMMD882]